MVEITVTLSDENAIRVQEAFGRLESNMVVPATIVQIRSMILNHLRSHVENHEAGLAAEAVHSQARTEVW